jgi:AraC-like DNA-binding protein
VADFDEHGNNLHRRLPDGTLDIVFNLGGPVYISGDEKGLVQMPQAALTGLYHDKRFLYYEGAVHLVGAVINPGFAHLFVRDASHIYSASTCDASLVLGNDVNIVSDQLHSMHSEKEKHQLLETFLIANLKHQKNDFHLNRMHLAIEQIQRYSGNVRLNSLSREHYIGERNFRRKFSEYVGMSPKKYASIVRVKSFCRSYHPGTANIQDIADALEYSDTSHLYKDFRRIVGIDPKSYFGQLNALGSQYIGLI